MKLVQQKHNQNIKVFLSDVSSDVASYYWKLLKVLEKAGFQVVTATDNAEIALSNSNCSVHLIGKVYENDVIGSAKSITEEQFILAQEKHLPDGEFKIFVWHPLAGNSSVEDTRQVSFVNTVKNSILQNMIYSKQKSPVLFVEDMRSLMYVDSVTKQETSDADVFFIYNELDEVAASGIVEVLSDIVTVQQLNVMMDTQINYSELIVQQLKQSKLAVIYFDKTANWAIPFVQQVWRKIGGASSEIEILLVGDADMPLNSTEIFDVPKVHSMTMSKDLIPLEVKVHYDKIVGVQ